MQTITYNLREYVLAWDNGIIRYKPTTEVSPEDVEDLPRELEVVSKPSEDPVTWIFKIYK